MQNSCAPGKHEFQSHLGYIECKKCHQRKNVPTMPRGTSVTLQSPGGSQEEVQTVEIRMQVPKHNNNII